ncbi:MAG: HTH-type transcriptional activator IlvY [Spirochaetales bacterium]|nr:HTH-type transcriptional activator IlvY [Spirochaetales bacterium]
MEIRTLELFLHLADTLHFGRTSEACFISPSALSRQIMALEEELDQRLFLRDHRRVELTKAGEIFRDHAQRVMHELSKASEALRQEDQDPRGRLRFFCSVTACYSILPGIIPGFRERYPGIRLDVKTGDAASAIPLVLSGETDLAVAALPDNLPGILAFKEITSTPLVFIAPRSFDVSGDILRAEQLPWSEIPLILTEKEPARKRVEKWCKTYRISPSGRSFVSGNEAIIAMVSLGLGLGVVPRLVVEKSPVGNEIRILDAAGELGSYTVGLCALRRNLSSPCIKAFWEAA